MMLFCIALSVAGIAAYISGDGQLIAGANLAISIVTLLLLPVLQATQTRDGAALQAKLDELIHASQRARDDLIGLETRPSAEIERLRP